MRILKEKDLNKTDSTFEVKDFLLYRTFLIVSIIGLPLCIVNFYFSFIMNLGNFPIIIFTMFLPSFICLLFYRKFKYSFKVILLLLTFLSIGFYNLYISAIFGAGLLIILTGTVLSVMFFDRKFTYYLMVLISISFIIIGGLYINGTKSITADIIKSSQSLSSWFMAIGLFYLLTGILVIMFGVLITKLSKRIREKEEHEKEILEAKRKAEESNALKSQFLKNLSHEIRTPLNGVVGFSRLLERENIDENKRKEYISYVLKSSDNLLKIIEDMLEISTIDAKQTQIELDNINFNNLCDKLFEKFNTTENNLNLILQKGESINNLEIYSDESILIKILLRILDNALKFTSEGEIKIGCDAIRDSIRIYVKDTGIGIHKEKQDIIFERFVQEDKTISVSYGGLGLGLSIAKEYANLLNAKIHIDSEKNKGTIVYLDLPYKLENN